MNNKNDIFLNFQDDKILEQLKESIVSSRESRKITKENVSKLLHIDLNLITHLENGDLKEIKYNVFNLGHIRTYLKWLNIDSNIFFDNIIKNKINISKERIKKNYNIFNKINIFIKFKFSNLIISILCICSCISIIMIWKNFSSKNIITKNSTNYINEKIIKYPIKSNNKITKNNRETKIQADPNFKKVIKNNDKPETSQNIKLIKIIALNDSWIEIQNNKTQTILSKIIKKNEEIELPYEKGLKLVTGNAGGIIIQINNKTIKNIGKNGEVKRNISLDYENLIKLLN